MRRETKEEVLYHGMGRTNINSYDVAMLFFSFSILSNGFCIGGAIPFLMDQPTLATLLIKTRAAIIQRPSETLGQINSGSTINSVPLALEWSKG